MKGHLHIYTGRGKGKTSAALGLGLRASSSGLRVLMFQFLKKRNSSCDNAVSTPRFKVVCFDEVHPMFGGSRKELAERVGRDFLKVKKAVMGGRHDVVILDEILNCVYGGVLKEGELLDLVEKRPGRIEMVLTGRGATKTLIRCADYVTDMRKVKHPFDNGTPPRKGIEY